MVFLIPQTFDVKRKFTAFGVTYNPGEQVPGETLAKLRSADTLLSRRFVIPTPDPHLRDTKPEHPTPTALPATVRKQMTGSGGTPPESVTVTPATASIYVGATKQYTAVVDPPEASQQVAWSSGNTNVGTVDANGLVTAIGVGSTQITATSSDPAINGVASFGASNPPPPPPETMAVTPASADCDVTLGVFEATLTVSFGPPGCGTIPVTWSSADELIATVASTGATTAVVTSTTNLGTVNITCTGGALTPVVVPVTFHAGLTREGPREKSRRRNPSRSKE